MKNEKLDPGEEDDIKVIAGFIDDPNPWHYSDLALSPIPALKPFGKRISEALFRLYEMEDILRIEGKELKAGRIKEGDKGFRLVRRAILMNRPEIVESEKRYGRTKEVGLIRDLKGTAFQRAYREIIPGNVAYLRFKNESYAPFLKNEWEARHISSWTARIAERYTGLVIIALMVIWTTLSLLILWT